MRDEEKDDTAPPDAPEADAELATEADAAPAPTPEEQLAALNDQLLRALAEIENTRRRGERERGEALKYGVMNFARDMVGVADNLRRALQAVEDMAPDDLSEAGKTLMAGVAAIERDLGAILQRHKISAIAPLGEKFDPNQHEALFEAANADHAAGTIIEVIEIGYRLDDRLLRPAKVGIARAPTDTENKAE